MTSRALSLNGWQSSWHHPCISEKGCVYSAVEGRAGGTGMGVQFRGRNASNAVHWLEVESWLCVMELQLLGGSGKH